MTPASAGSPKGQDPERGLIAEGDNIAVGAADAPNPCFTTPNPILEGVELREAYARVIERLRAGDLCLEMHPVVTGNHETWDIAREIVGHHHAKVNLVQAVAVLLESAKATPLIGLSQVAGCLDLAREMWAVEMENSDGLAKESCAADIRAGTMDETPPMLAIVKALSGLSLPGRDADGLLDAARDAEVEIRALREWIDDHVPSKLIASEDWGKLHRPLVTRTVTKNLRAAIAAHESALSTVQDGSVREALDAEIAALVATLSRIPDDTPDHAFASIDMTHGQARALLAALSTLPQSPAPISGDAS